MVWNSYTFAAVVLCAAVIYYFVFYFTKAFRFLTRFAVRLAVGLCVISAFNYVASAYSMHVGINVFTCCMCGTFGLPGYILLLGTRIMF